MLASRGGDGLALSRARLFVVSYAPLAFMFAARFWTPHHIVSLTFVAVGVFGLVDAIRLVTSSRRVAGRRVTVETVKDHGGAVSGYLATYLLPFLGNLPQSPGDVLAYALYFVTALVIYTRSDELALVNPTLYALGYRIVSIRASERTSLAISRSIVRPGDRIEVRDFMSVLVIHRVMKGDA